jgi:hypothetical protein
LEVNLHGLPTLPATAIKNALRRVEPFEILEAESEVADQIITIKHKLLAVPRAFFWSTDSSTAIVYADATCRELWSASSVAVKCSTADTAISLLVIA